MKKFAWVLLASLPFLAWSQEEKWTPEEIINTVYVSGPEFSRDGSKLVWSQRKGLTKEDKFVSKLHLARLGLSKQGRLVPGVNERHLVFTGIKDTKDEGHKPRIVLRL